ncbi:hypothetical protein [Streptosporangium longisporum]|uniref:Uncharacterized protein n=1 Tax=Streptosporangium longisporum TaxID=46187 RepID=A0ABN3XRZ9_9ACTN
MTAMFAEPPEPPESRKDGHGSGGPPPPGGGGSGGNGRWDIGATGDPSPEPLHEWRTRGFTVAEARRWIEAGFLAFDAERWRTSGVYTPGAAREWRTAGATPYTVDVWLRAGMTPRDAVRWREMGHSPQEAAERHLAGERPWPVSRLGRLFGRARRRAGTTDDPAGSEAMRELLRGGVPAATARGFVEAGWSGRDALDWARRGVEPADAKVFHALGLTPTEAADLIGRGQDAISVMTRWWEAGVPPGEVAAWCGAGFDAEEAARLREEGTGVEQARILRALTPPGEP